MNNWMRVSSIALCAGVLFAAGGAVAQTLDEETDFGLPQYYGRGKNVSVMERERPDYEAVGIHAGGFTIFPKLETGIDYSDNLFAVNGNSNGLEPPFNGPKSDVGFIINPSILAQSNWGRHGLVALASVKDETFADYPSEDRLAYTMQANGRIDVHGDSYLNLGFDTEHDYEDRGSTTTQTQAVKPVAYDTQGIFGRGLYSSDRFRAAVDLDFRNYHYFDVEELNPPVNNVPQPDTLLDERLRDFTQGRIGLRTDYALTPDEAVFGKFTYSVGDYFFGDAFSPKRNYDQTEFLFGANFDITALARGEIGVGYIDREYDLSVYRGISGLAASVKVEYFPTQLVTVTLTGQRLVEDAAFSTASGYFENVVSLGADWEVRRNIIVSAVGGVEIDQFQGINRTDTVDDFKLIGKYFVNRYVGLGSTLSYRNRDSSGTPGLVGPIYDETRLMFNLVFQR
jgi:hypothetical protein